MALYKLCSHCGRRVPMGESCHCKAVQDREAARQKRYDKVKRDRESKHFYSSKRWQAVRNEVLAMAYGLDEVEWMNGNGIKGTLIHHIEPLKEAPERALDPYNLICVSADTHSRIHKLYETGKKEETQAMLLKLAADRMKRHER